MKDLDYGKGYDLPATASSNQSGADRRWQAGIYTNEDLLPEKLKKKKYLR